MNKKIMIIFILVMFTFFVSSCSSQDNDDKIDGEKMSTEVKEPVVIAKVGDKTITESDFEKMFSLWADGEDSEFLEKEEQGITLEKAMRTKILRDTMVSLAYENYYIKKEDPIKDEELNEKYSVFVENLNSDKSKKDLFDKLGVDETLIKESLARNYYNIKFREEVDKEFRKTYNLTDEDLKRQKLTVNVRHILVPELEEATEIFDSLKSGSDFENLVKDKSIDEASKIKRGEIGTISFYDMPIQFSKAVFNMNEGEIAGPIKTIFGYHVIEMLKYETVGDMMADKDISEDELNETKEMLYQRALDIEIYNRQEELLKEFGAEILREINDGE